MINQPLVSIIMNYQWRKYLEEATSLFIIKIIQILK